MAVLAVHLLSHLTNLGRMLELQAGHGERRGGRIRALILGLLLLTRQSIVSAGSFWRFSGLSDASLEINTVSSPVTLWRILTHGIF
jgi:hypothetical protein